MKGERTENRSAKNQVPSSVQESSSPTRQVPVAGRNEREAVTDSDFVGREGEAKISLREGGDAGAEGGGQMLSGVICRRQWGGKWSCDS